MRRLSTVLAALLVLAGSASCGDGTDTAGDDEPVGQDLAAGDPEPGTIAVNIEETDGVFVEGFEVGLRFETPDGEVVASTLWTDFVDSLGAESIDAYYDSVLEQEVPAGTIVVLASANIGMGPPPEVPDLEGDLPCRLEVEVPESGRVNVEVVLDGPGGCLRLP